MEVTELTTRLVRRYWLVLVVAVVVPVLAVGAYTVRHQRTYTAHARIVAADTMPKSTAEAAGVVSQVQALITSRDVVAGALSEAHLPRNADQVAKAITVRGLGSSALVDLAYRDRDPAMAQKVTAALANTAAAKLDAVRIGGLPEVLASVDNQLTDLATKRAPIAADAQANPRDPVAQNRLAGIDRLISDLSADRDRLAEDAASAGHATVVANPVRPVHADTRNLPAKLSVAALLGLAVALIAVGAYETLRPAVSGASRVARLLEAPVLGAVSPDPVAQADLGRRIRLAARAAGVDTVVLAKATGGSPAPEVVDRIVAAAVRGESQAASDVEATAVLRRGGTGLLTLSAPPPPNGNTARTGAPLRVCAVDELDPSAEADRIGLVVLAGGRTRLRSLDGVRDLLSAAGWPLLGVVGEVRR